MSETGTAIPRINFTDSAYSVLYDVVDDPDFLQQDADIIYKALRRRLRAVPFCEYLKRYVYRAAEMTEPFESVSDDVFRGVITASFRETGTPFTLAETGAGKSAAVKNWLVQKSVRREAALLLGFGLKMTVEEVDEMLYKALRERSLDPAVPEELIAWYCFGHGCTWAKYNLFTNCQWSFSAIENTSFRYARSITN